MGGGVEARSRCMGHQIYSMMMGGPRNTQTKCVPEFAQSTHFKYKG